MADLPQPIFSVRDGGVWKPVQKVWVRQNGSWKSVGSLSVRRPDGTWSNRVSYGPNAPTNLGPLGNQSTSYTSFGLSWTASTGASVGSYTVYRYTWNADRTQRTLAETVANVVGTSYSFNNLSTDSYYSFEVQAIGTSGAPSPMSAEYRWVTGRPATGYYTDNLATVNYTNVSPTTWLASTPHGGSAAKAIDGSDTAYTNSEWISTITGSTISYFDLSLNIWRTSGVSVQNGGSGVVPVWFDVRPDPVQFLSVKVKAASVTYYAAAGKFNYGPTEFSMFGDQTVSIEKVVNGSPTVIGPSKTGVCSLFPTGPLTWTLGGITWSTSEFTETTLNASPNEVLRVVVSQTSTTVESVNVSRSTIAELRLTYSGTYKDGTQTFNETSPAVSSRTW